MLNIYNTLLFLLLFSFYCYDSWHFSSSNPFQGIPLLLSSSEMSVREPGGEYTEMLEDRHKKWWWQILKEKRLNCEDWKGTVTPLQPQRNAGNSEEASEGVWLNTIYIKECCIWKQQSWVRLAEFPHLIYTLFFHHHQQQRLFVSHTGESQCLEHWQCPGGITGSSAEGGK